jgi:DNA helicase II / ATP-dependent DNA helicase PcrA
LSDVVQVSYTGDILAHRRCPRSWAFEKYAEFRPYEQVQAMEGRLVHHAMEWLTRRFRDTSAHATEAELRDQLDRYFSILWARGVKTAFTDKATTLDRVLGNVFPGGTMHPTVRAAIEGAVHAEYEIRAVRKVLPGAYFGKSRILLTGVVDLVVQERTPLTYRRSWEWTDLAEMNGQLVARESTAVIGETEIWDYKATRAATGYLADYARQVMTYAALYRDRTGELPSRCILFFLNEPDRDKQLLAIETDDATVTAAVGWTERQVAELRQTVRAFEADPVGLDGGDMTLGTAPLADRVTGELAQQCTSCGVRFDCRAYAAHLGGPTHPDIYLLNVDKN